MDRSQIYFDQEMTESELNQLFDDVETMEENRTIDLDIWGVWTGFDVTESATPDLNVAVTAGVAQDQLGRRIVMASPDSVDLSSYVPSVGGEQIKVHLYCEDEDIESDPRVDGYSTPLNYRHTESYDFFVKAGTPSSPPATPPSLETDKVLLAEITINNGDTQIFNSDIAKSWILNQRHEGGIVARRGRATTDDIYFDSTGDRLIKGHYFIDFKAASSPGDLGIDMNERGIEDVGEIQMLPVGSGGLGLDLNGTDIVDGGNINTDTITMDTGGGATAIDMNDRNIIDINQLLFVTGTGTGIDLNGKNIVKAGYIELTTGTGTGIDFSGKNVLDVGVIEFTSGTGLGIDLNGKFAQGINYLLLTAGTGTGLNLNGKNITNGGDIYADDFYATNDYSYSSGKSIWKIMPIEGAEIPGDDWDYRAPSTPGQSYWVHLESGGDIYFPIVIPHNVYLTDVEVMIFKTGTETMDLEVYELPLDWGSPGTPTPSLIGSGTNSSAGTSVISATSINTYIDNTDSRYLILIDPNSTGQEKIWGIRVKYTIIDIVGN